MLKIRNLLVNAE